MEARTAIRQKAEEILSAIGCVGLEAHRGLLELCVEATSVKLAAGINMPENEPLPSGLRPAAAMMAAGELLFILRSTGKLEGFDFEAAVKSVRLGDADVSFAQDGQDTAEQRFDRLVRAMRTLSGEELVCYRRLYW